MTEQEKFEVLKLFAKAVRIFGAKAILTDFLMYYPSEYHQISNVYREPPDIKVPKLHKKW